MNSKVNSQGDDLRPIPRRLRFVYGSGDWGRASFNTLRTIFYAIFLTDVVGLDPRLASIAAFIGILWDAINDPVVGNISDHVKTRWGRRRPFLLFFSIPFALAFVLLWWAPPWHSQILLMVHVMLAYMISDTIQTLITVPYLSLTPELAPSYDSRTSLTTIRMFFNLVSSLVTAVAAPSIVDAVVNAGFSQQQGYMLVGALFGSLAIIPYLLIFFLIRERKLTEHENSSPVLSPKATAKILWNNRPFRFAAGIYILNWIAFDLVSLMLPYFLLYWVAQGDLLAKINLVGIKLSIDSAFLGILFLTAIAVLPIWYFISHKFSKRSTYIGGMTFWIIVQCLVMAIAPGQSAKVLLFAFVAGISVSVAHVMPEAIFPDVIDWDELRTNGRREGIYYGAINFLRKLSSAFAVFLALQVLGWVGYQSPPEGAINFSQSLVTQQAIRILSGPFVAILIICATILAFFYPLSRDRQARIQRILARRQRRLEKHQGIKHE
jgi:glycoside/pentoside/hexuronide:cation symporter, GPH family